ncbi:MAG: metal-sensing transcriptional repressor [Patescibacteria group bacterium]
MSIECDIKEVSQHFNRLQGQIQGIGGMIQDKRACSEVLQQIVAARASLERLGRLLLEVEATGCFGSGTGSQDKIKKLERTVAQLFKITS